MTFKCLTQNGLRQFYKTVFEGHEGYTAFNLLCQLIVHGSTDTNTAWLKNGIICGPHWWKTCTVPWIAVGTFQAANICSRWPLSYIAKYGDQAVSSKKKKSALSGNLCTCLGSSIPDNELGLYIPTQRGPEIQARRLTAHYQNSKKCDNHLIHKISIMFLPKPLSIWVLGELPEFVYDT